MAVLPQPLDDPAVDVLVGDEVHADCLATGRTTSAPSAPAAYRRTARTASRVSRGCDSSNWSKDSPAPSLRRMSSTVIRVPATTGLPSITAGSDVIRGV